MCNLSISGQLFRITVGAVLLFLAWYGPQTGILDFEWIRLWNLGWLGLVPLLSGIAAFCPIYAVFGFGQRRKPGHDQSG